MIQRIQTVFLLFGTLIAITLFIVPVQLYTSPDGNTPIAYTLLPFGAPAATSPIIYGLFAANAGVLLLSLIAIFQFKNRKKQLRTSRMLLLLSAMQMGLLFVFELCKVEGFVKSYTWAAYLPAGTIVFALLAGVFIKKDEELVRSADRLR